MQVFLLGVLSVLVVLLGYTTATQHQRIVKLEEVTADHAKLLRENRKVDGAQGAAIEDNVANITELLERRE